MKENTLLKLILSKIKGLSNLLEINDFRARSLKSCQSGIISGAACDQAKIKDSDDRFCLLRYSSPWLNLQKMMRMMNTFQVQVCVPRPRGKRRELLTLLLSLCITKKNDYSK